MTPWFAAGTGIVLAVGLWIASPHTVLRFPTAAPNAVALPPGQRDIVSTNGQRGGHLTAKTPVQLKSKAGARARVKVTYSVVWQRHFKYGLLITITGQRLPADWRLSFRLPGDRILDAWGASWRGSAGGEAATFSVLQWPSGDHQPRDGQQGDREADQAAGDSTRHRDGGRGTSISFFVTASGTPVTPTRCRFDGKRCTFTEVQPGR